MKKRRTSGAARQLSQHVGQRTRLWEKERKKKKDPPVKKKKNEGILHVKNVLHFSCLKEGREGAGSSIRLHFIVKSVLCGPN